MRTWCNGQRRESGSRPAALLPVVACLRGDQSAVEAREFAKPGHQLHVCALGATVSAEKAEADQQPYFLWLPALEATKADLRGCLSLKVPRKRALAGVTNAPRRRKSANGAAFVVARLKADPSESGRGSPHSRQLCDHAMGSQNRTEANSPTVRNPIAEYAFWAARLKSLT